MPRLFWGALSMSPDVVRSIRSRLTALGAGLREINRRLATALALYALLAIVAGFTLDGYLRVALWLLFAWLALKTWRHSDDSDMDVG